MTKSFRRSKSITIYGLGVILEGPEGPRVILVLARSDLFNQQHRPANFEVTDLRLSHGFLLL